jgi:hypothetical protein
MPALPSLSPVFVAAAVIFIGIAVKDFLRQEGKLTPARKAWLHIALVFAAVGIGLYLLQVFSA